VTSLDGSPPFKSVTSTNINTNIGKSSTNADNSKKKETMRAQNSLSPGGDSILESKYQAHEGNATARNL